MTTVVHEAAARLQKSHDFHIVMTALIRQAADGLLATDPMNADALRAGALIHQTLNTVVASVEELATQTSNLKD